MSTVDAGGKQMSESGTAIRVRPLVVSLLAACLAGVFASFAQGQVLTLSKQDLIEYTAQNPFDRFPDGRPKVPDSIIERARGMSSEEVFAILPGKGFRYQY